MAGTEKTTGSHVTGTIKAGIPGRALEIFPIETNAFYTAAMML
ncbi:hypothetical protein [Methanoculleus sp. 7T]|nr:hypothetical protein [Methanoculleus sp. 7T]